MLSTYLFQIDHSFTTDALCVGADLTNLFDLFHMTVANGCRFRDIRLIAVRRPLKHKRLHGAGVCCQKTLNSSPYATAVFCRSFTVGVATLVEGLCRYKCQDVK